MAIDYQERIPNNVDLASNRTLQRALEDPVLPGGQPAEDLRLHRLGAGEAQVRLHAGERVGRQ